MSRTSCVWMGPAVTSSRERETARELLRSTALKIVLVFVQVAGMFLGFTVLMQGKGW